MKRQFNRRDFLLTSLAGAASLPLASRLLAAEGDAPRPNILWITSEDNGPFLGCYGDPLATTPNLDQFASDGIVYENALANAPVCAPARFTIITGVHACSAGTENMRSRYPIPSFIRPFVYYLRQAGYYCTNRRKTDYNFETNDCSHWDECGNDADYMNRAPGQPFFAVINFTTTHESSVHNRAAQIDHDPDQIQLPPYHPDTTDIRTDWAQYYDRVEMMDAQVGEVLDELEQNGLAEDTIVFYYSDHGGVICRSKRFVFESGTHVPMIVRFPEKYQHVAPGEPGSRTDRVVSFVDLAPTVLSLAGIQPPDHMQGHAFLGTYEAPAPGHVFLFRGRMDERYDLMRAVRGPRYRYIRNYMPHRIYGQHVSYLWRAAATRSWEQEYLEGRCNEAQSAFWETKPTEELYDVQADPWEVNNLAGDEAHAATLASMRETLSTWVRNVRDVCFVPEGELYQWAGSTTPYAKAREPEFPMERIIETAEMASWQDPARLSELVERLSDPVSSVRFWAATGCAILGPEASTARENLESRLTDGHGDVRVTAAEALCRMDACDQGLPVIVSALRNSNPRVALRAANILQSLGARAKPALPGAREALAAAKDDYVTRALEYFVEQAAGWNESGFVVSY